jgi:methionyl-tRNA synthetase
MATLQQFKELDLRVGRVLSVEDHPNADKLYVLKVDVGGGVVRQLVAGLRPYMPPEALLNRQVVVVCGLEPAVLRGLESQGMVLAVSGGGTVSLLQPDREVENGSVVS